MYQLKINNEYLLVIFKKLLINNELKLWCTPKIWLREKYLLDIKDLMYDASKFHFHIKVVQKMLLGALKIKIKIFLELLIEFILMIHNFIEIFFITKLIGHC